MLLPEEREHQRACDLAIWHEILTDIAERLGYEKPNSHDRKMIQYALEQQYPELERNPLCWLDRENRTITIREYPNWILSLTEGLRHRGLK